MFVDKRRTECQASNLYLAITATAIRARKQNEKFVRFIDRDQAVLLQCCVCCK